MIPLLPTPSAPAVTPRLVTASKYTPIPRLVRRRLYKRERRPDHKPGVLAKQPPVGVPDASPFEIVSAVDIICRKYGIRVGQGGEYDRQRDEYVVIGKSGPRERPQEYDVPGWMVTQAIIGLRYELRMKRCDPNDYRRSLGINQKLQLRTYRR